jgi:hypothetical protein
MLNRTIVLTSLLSSLMTLVILIVSLLLFSAALAQTAGQASAPTGSNAAVVSVSALAFLPTQPRTAYTKDSTQQWLKLESPGLLTAVAPLQLPHGAMVANLSTYGLFLGGGNQPNGQYTAQMLLKQCPLNGQSPCEAAVRADLVANAVSDQPLNWGQPANVAVNNQNFTYFLEFNTQDPHSALRAVQLQLGQVVGPVVGPTNPETASPAVGAAIQDLIRQGIPANRITVRNVEPTTWPDANLGCPRPGMVGIQIPVEGYLIILEAEGQAYRYHTDQSGSSVILCQ